MFHRFTGNGARFALGDAKYPSRSVFGPRFFDAISRRVVTGSQMGSIGRPGRIFPICRRSSWTNAWRWKGCSRSFSMRVRWSADLGEKRLRPARTLAAAIAVSPSAVGSGLLSLSECVHSSPPGRSPDRIDGSLAIASMDAIFLTPWALRAIPA